LSGEEMREACRALRGSMLRQEIYAADGTDASDRPYTTTEHNYTIEMLQPQGPNPYGVFYVHPRESIDCHYDRALLQVIGTQLSDQSHPAAGAVAAADPRVGHAVTLAVDPFGNVLESLEIAYGRRYVDPALTPADQAKQLGLLSTCSRRSYTNPILDAD